MAHTTGGVPDGTKAVSNVQTLRRVYDNNASQHAREDDYIREKWERASLRRALYCMRCLAGQAYSLPKACA